MAIVNRDLDGSEQKMVLSLNQVADVATGLTMQVAVVPFPCEIKAMAIAASGLSNTPTYQLGIGRLVSGGYTFISGGATLLTARAFGTSGAVVFTGGSSGLATSGSSLLQCQAGDVLTVVSGGASCAVKQLNVQVVVQALQDIKSWHGM